MNSTYLYLTLLIVSTAVFADDGQEELDLATADLSEIDRRLNNPLTSIWSFTFQNNTAIKEGDAIDGSETSNTLFFQPFLPFELGKEDQVMMTLRPVIPLLTQPTFKAPDRRNSSGHTTGIGDVQLLTLFGPNKGKGLVWGAGGTFVFPTADSNDLGQGKYQVGPSAMLFYMGKPWVGGILAQHWNSYAGDGDRSDVSRSEVQYILRRSIPNAMSIGMGPTISYDWKADSDNALTLPIGLGVTKTTRWGGKPVKLRAEVHYSVIRSDDYGTEWNFRFQITPVINSPMK
jgi:hypothetical protein